LLQHDAHASEMAHPNLGKSNRVIARTLLFVTQKESPCDDRRERFIRHFVY
jgi:hypothetical protein